jgi:hypothetical protein
MSLWVQKQSLVFWFRRFTIYHSRLCEPEADVVYSREWGGGSRFWINSWEPRQNLEAVPKSFLDMSARTDYRGTHMIHSRFLLSYNCQNNYVYVCEWQSNINLLLNFSWIRFWFVIVVPKYLNCATFSKYLLAILMSWFCLMYAYQNIIACLEH